METISDYQPILIYAQLKHTYKKKKELGYQDTVRYSVMTDQKIVEALCQHLKKQHKNSYIVGCSRKGNWTKPVVIAK